MNLTNVDVTELNNKNFTSNKKHQSNFYLCHPNYKPISNIDFLINEDNEL